jgi:hypothetical protein
MPQACLFSFLFESPSWATPIARDDGVWHSVSKTKIADELPILTDKPDTIKRHMKALEDAGLIVRKTQYRGTDSIPLFQLTTKAKTWNRLDAFEVSDISNLPVSEKNPDPTQAGNSSEFRREKNPDPIQAGNSSEFGREKNPDPTGKIFREGREKNPANQPTNYPYTNDQSNLLQNNTRIDRSGIELTDDWLPSGDTLARIAIAGIPENFTLAVLPEFKSYWLMSPALPKSGSWDVSLLQHAKSAWVKAQNDIGKAATAAKWQFEDFDWSSWSARGDFNPDHVRHWLQVRQAARKVVTQELVDSVAQTLADAANDVAVTFGMVAEDAMLAGWITIRYEWLVKRFGVAPSQSSEAKQGGIS